MKNKFNIGDKVKFIKDKDSDAGKIVGFGYSEEKGYVYTISSKEVDLEKKEIIDGVKNCNENEIVAVK